MIGDYPDNKRYSRSYQGIVLLVTLVLLVMLSTAGYILSGRLSAQRHRNRYLIDYSIARYGCDSAVKYAIASLEEIEPNVISRPNEPDFSDVFALSEAEYKEILDQWTGEDQFGSIGSSQSPNDVNDINDINDINDVNGVKDVNDVNYAGYVPDINDANALYIRGPYGPEWPFVTEPVEFEIGAATVRIEIEDENAKYPLVWGLLEDEEIKDEVETSLKTFCEWMEVDNEQIDLLKSQLKQVSEIKPFKFEFKPINEEVTKTEGESEIDRSRGISRGSRRGRRTRPSRMQRENVTVPASVHTADFAKLFHSSLIDIETLAMPTIIGEERKESALKYLGMWASKQVNINTAPRQVLEATFVFGGDEVEIAEEIIQRRRIKPFKDIGELKKLLFAYSDSIGKCEKYITTVSSFFTVRVTAVSGVAKVSTIMAITKEGKKIEQIAVISG